LRKSVIFAFQYAKVRKNSLTTKGERVNIGDKAPERLGVNENGIIEQVFLLCPNCSFPLPKL
jgi:hypothetical protein